MEMIQNKYLQNTENLQQISTMALFIQLHSSTIQQENRQQTNFLSPDRLQSILVNLKKSLTLGGTQTIILEEETTLSRLKLAFIAEVDRNSQLFFQIWLTKSLQIKNLVILGHKGSYLRIRSSEIRKNMCKTVSFINTVNKKSHIFFVINSRTGQLQFSTSYYLGRSESRQTITFNLKSLITQCLNFAKHFNSLILYKANLITKQNFYQNCSEKVRSLFFNSNGYFATLHKMQQFLSLSNCKISQSLRQTKNARYEKDHNEHVNIQRIREIFYNRSYTHDIILYTENSFNSRTKKAKLQTEDYNSLMVDYRPKQCAKYDNNYVFSTIYLYQEQLKQKKKQVCVAQTQKIKALLINTKINYGLTLPSNDVKHLMDGLSIQQNTLQNQLTPAASRLIEKYLVVKIPNPKLSPSMQERVVQIITYQKMVLRNLRGAECRYLPKYYQTQQKNVKYRDSLLIDFIPGPTLGSILLNNIKHKSIAWKINLLMHLSNAIRFLQSYDIAHLDISVNNIIIADNGFPKIIDFGEAFHQQTTQSFLRLRKVKQNSHRPGRTFPFAAPETTINDWKFTSKQDIFSLGMIAFYLVMGYFPNTCSDRNIPKWYINGNFNESILFSPQGLEWIAQNEIMLSCLQLTLNCLHNNQKIRPNPAWAHIIFAMILQLVDPNN